MIISLILFGKPQKHELNYKSPSLYETLIRNFTGDLSLYFRYEFHNAPHNRTSPPFSTRKLKHCIWILPRARPSTPMAHRRRWRPWCGFISSGIVKQKQLMPAITRRYCAGLIRYLNTTYWYQKNCW